ncbi:MAG TPA: AcrB/AcrD/AcrF family protein [Sphingomonadaceae bacterium]|nr:AcrB/AcrD/AcrF family protein [Sphingomonadaceae bacterium]
MTTMPSTHPADAGTDPIAEAVPRRWFCLTMLFWLVTSLALIGWKWGSIHWFALGDTDDNMRMSQVRALLAGQGWFDLRQHKLDPLFGGANIHWSRIVDLPIAGLILALKPVLGGALAEKWAAGIAPLIPFGVALWAGALATRRLVAPAAFALASAILLCAPNTMGMWMPLRIDHHGWQLALLMLAVAAIADRNRVRGGWVLGVSSAISIAIGLEMLPYIALLGGLTALWWVWDRAEAPRLGAYGASLAAGCALGYAGFASWDNRLPVCDALSPVWLSAALFGGGLMVALAFLRAEDRRVRLGCAVVAALLVAGGFALAWPQCLARPEHVSPELYQLWLKNVREAKPIYAQSWRVAVPMTALPVVGVVGSLYALRRAWGTDRAAPWGMAALLTIAAFGLLLWQTRAAPAAQMLAVPGATALGWGLMRWLLGRRRALVRVAGAATTFLLVSGLIVSLAVKEIPAPKPSAYRKAVRQANAKCPTLPALRPIAGLPATTILTFVDLGPRLITVTHHSAIGGPYHRNGAAIIDIHHAFRSADPEVAHQVMRRHGATLLLICPGMSESTIYASEAKKGFYTQLDHGHVPGWLVPVPLPKGSPYKLWRRIG